MEDLHLYIYGEIGGGFFEEASSTPESIQKDLADRPGADVICHLSSPGGGVFEGFTIGNILKNSGRKTTAQIEGLCASIATFIALSCDRVEMAETAMFMIHDPTVGIEGDEDDLQKGAEQLAKIKDELIKAYREKTGLSISQISAMMEKETTMNATEAKAQGFVDGFMTPIKIAAKLDIKNMKTETVLTESKAKELDGILDNILAKGKKLAKEIFGTMDVTVTLADGTSIFVESEDEELVGMNAFLIDEEGNRTDTPAPDGAHALADGRTMTVEGGVVTALSDDDEEEEDKKIIEDLKAELAAEAESKKELEGKLKEAAKQHTETMTEVKNLKTLTVGTTGKPKKPIINAISRFNEQEPEVHRMEGFRNTLRKQRSRM